MSGSDGDQRRLDVQRGHTVTVTWSMHLGEPWSEFGVVCPYAPEDHDKPCRLWGDDTEGTSGVFKDGCFIVQTHEAVGIENGYLVIPDGVAPPWSCYVVGSGDQAHLIHVDLAGLET